MITKLYNGRVILPDGISEEACVYYENGVITAVTAEDLPHDEEIDAGGNYISPGFIDIHVHGGDGYEFVDATEDAIVKACELHYRHGTTTIFPTVSGRTAETMKRALAAIREVKNSGKAPSFIAGAHLEGPYFSPAQAGAQAFMCQPDKSVYEEIIRDYGDILSRWSYAPEVDEDLAFIHYLNDHNIISSAGHTDALYDSVMRAYRCGMKLITHLYSCTSTVVRKDCFRYAGVIEAAYLTDDMAVETIADGRHLPPELLKLVYKIKGPDQMCLVTDSIRHGGVTEDGFSTDTYIVEDGVAKLKDRTAFAGSVATADRLIRTCVTAAGISLCDAVKMMTATPARIMGLSKKGRIAYGCDADFVLFDDAITVTEVIRASRY